jgi:hypothetical protein
MNLLSTSRLRILVLVGVVDIVAALALSAAALWKGSISGSIAGTIFTAMYVALVAFLVRRRQSRRVVEYFVTMTGVLIIVLVNMVFTANDNLTSTGNLIVLVIAALILGTANRIILKRILPPTS